MPARLTGIIIVVSMVLGALTISNIEQAQAEGKHSTFKGRLVCLACTLKDEDGARAECRNFGHTHALRTSDGKFISFLENKYSEELFKGEKYRDKEISASGVYYPEGNMLDVQSYTIDNIAYTWCPNHEIMDNCNSKPNKN